MLPPWIQYEITPAVDRQTGDHVRLLTIWCTACGERAIEPASHELIHGFVRTHAEHESRSPSHFGLGDLIARFTRAIGMETCEPCEQRRVDLNQRVPQIWRRG